MTVQEVQKKLCDILGSPYCYTEPPSKGIKYPCFMLTLSDSYIHHADNIPYRASKEYTITYISKVSKDDILGVLLSEFQYISFDRMYVADHLYHYIFSLYI